MLKKIMVLVPSLIFIGVSSQAEENLCKKIVDDIMSEAKLGESFDKYDNLFLNKKTEPFSDILKPLNDAKVKLEAVERKIQAEISYREVLYKKLHGIQKLSHDEKTVYIEGFYDPKLGAQFSRKSLIISENNSVLKKMDEQKTLSNFVHKSCDIGTNGDFKTQCLRARQDLKKLELDIAKQLKPIAEYTTKKNEQFKAQWNPVNDEIKAIEDRVSALNGDSAVLRMQARPQTQDQILAQLIAEENPNAEFKMTTLSTSATVRNEDKEKLAALQKRKQELLTALSGTTEMLTNVPQDIKQLGPKRDYYRVDSLREMMNNAKLPEYIRSQAKNNFDKIIKHQNYFYELGGADSQIRADLAKVESELALLSPQPLVQVILKNNVIDGIQIYSPVNMHLRNGCKDFFMDTSKLTNETSYNLDKDTNKARAQLIESILGVKKSSQIGEMFGGVRSYSPTLDNNNAVESNFEKIKGNSNLRKYMDWAQKAKQQQKAPAAPAPAVGAPGGVSFGS